MTTKLADQFGLWLHASPMGKRAGFLTCADGSGGGVTVTVLPKMWHPRRQVVRRYGYQAGVTTNVVAHEGDYIHLLGPTELLGSLALNLSRLTGTAQSELLVTSPPPERQRDAFDAEIGDPFNELIDLMLVADKGGIDPSDESYDGVGTMSLMRIIAQERLLRAVEPLLFRARPRYIERTEKLSVPRGRPHDSSVLLASITRQPYVDCTFDDLTMDTLVLRVILASLHVVVTDRLPAEIAALRPRLPARALELIRHLSAVQLVSRESAAIIASQLWLGPLERYWEPAIEAAKPVLRGFGIIPADEPMRSTDSVQVHVFTEKFWEQTVHAILQAAFGEISASSGGSPGAGVAAPQPWTAPDRESPPGAYPDYMFQLGPKVVLADAKYKSAALGAADGYQLFAYSQLASLGGAMSDIGLVLYPATPGTEAVQRALTRMPDRRYTLWLVSLPFPERTDLRNQPTWDHYISRTALALRGLAREWG